MFFSPKCPYCGGKNLYLKRDNLIEQYGCRDCEQEIKYMRNHDIPEDVIRSLFAKRKKDRQR